MPTLTLSDLYFIPSLISPPQHACLRYTDVSDASNFALTSAQNIQFRGGGGLVSVLVSVRSRLGQDISEMDCIKLIYMTDSSSETSNDYHMLVLSIKS